MDFGRELENFISLLIEQNAINNHKAERTVVRTAYINFRSRKTIRPFWNFLMEMWKYWYVNRFTKQVVIFDPAWINYLQQRVKYRLQNKEQTFEEKFITTKSCVLCLEDFATAEDFEKHKDLLEHQIRIIFVKNKKSFHLTPDLDLEIIEQTKTVPKISTKIKTPINASLILTNKSKCNYEIHKIIRINIQLTELQLDVSKQLPSTIKSGESIEISLKGYFETSCTFMYPIVIIARNDESNVLNQILKEIPFEVTSEFSELESYGIKYKNKTTELKNFNREGEEVIPGFKLKTQKSEYKPKILLKKYEISKLIEFSLNQYITDHPNFVKRYNNTGEVNHMKTAMHLNVPTRLLPENYAELLDVLLYIEENQMRVDIRDYDNMATLKEVKDRIYELKVPGLSEARPSLLEGDSVFIKLQRTDKIKYEGVVHKVLLESVYLGVDKKFVSLHFNGNMRFHIEFGFNRRTLRVEHQAIEFVTKHKVAPYFFPKPQLLSLEEGIKKEIVYFEKYLNEEQKCAVHHILQRKSVPYLLFGPPGTGKTFTLVEAILQVWKTIPDSKILVCAPSNAAANEITQRLYKKVPKSDIFRLLGSIYGMDKQNFNLAEISNVDEFGNYSLPAMKELLNYRILLTTVVTSARLVNGGIPDNHYSYVFIDESGYATETETIIPIAGVLTNLASPGKVAGQVVLAGDPKQLGPRIHSNFVKFCGLGTSMLERLMKTCDLYARNEENLEKPYDPRYVTKLIKNYRSHETILELPNKLFYHDELVAMGNGQTDLFCKWEHLNKKDFPVMFHNVQGEDKQDEDSPSFYNIQEVEEVISYLSKLIDHRVSGMKINQSDIGVITPYRKQVEKLQKACKSKNWNRLLIGSVEQFQGKEKLVVIISTVRSKSNRHLEHFDKRFQLGFLRNPKRFNVALTRPKALLIVVGNPYVLKNDQYWNAFIQYCEKNNSIVGKKTIADYKLNGDCDEVCSQNVNDVDEGNEGADFSRGIV